MQNISKEIIKENADKLNSIINESLKKRSFISKLGHQNESPMASLRQRLV